MRSYEIEHVVTFEETNLVGNVYFARYLSWQGRCREMFLHDRAPGVLTELGQDLRLVTTHVSCDYFAELFAFDRVVVRMTLRTLSQTRLAMAFEYLRRGDSGDELVARGEQEAACLRVGADGAAAPARLPAELTDALGPYSGEFESALT